MTDDPGADRARDRAFRDERAARLRAQRALVADTEGEIRRLLEEALTKIKAELAGMPSDYAEWRLTALKTEVERVLADAGSGMTAAVTGGLARAWQGGVDLVDQPLAKAGVTPRLVSLDGQLLRQMQRFCTDRISGVTLEAANKIGSHLGLVMMGAKTPFEAVGAVADVLGSDQARAVMIVRTELGRAYSAATQARQDQAVAAGVKGMRKQWRRSGKRHPRHSHEAIDGQIQPVDQPFQLENGVKLMYPRDPKGPPKEAINCGCVSLPYMAHWDTLHPKEAPFTRAELNTSPHRRLLQDARVNGVAQWSADLLSGRLRPSGRSETLGTINPSILKALADLGIRPATAEIAITDRELLGLRLPRKVSGGTALPPASIADLPSILDAPKAVYLDHQAKGGQQLVYAFAVPGEDRLGKIIIKLRDTDTRARQVSRHNWLTSGALVSTANLNDVKAYTRLDQPGVRV